MPKTQGTQDDLTPEEISKAVEDATVQYHWWGLVKMIAETEFDLTMAMALEAEEPLD